MSSSHDFFDIQNYRFYIHLHQTYITLTSMLRPDETVFPDDKTGEMMRHFLDKKSNFDGMAQWWFTQSFLFKAAAMTTLSLSFGLMGGVVGAGLLFGLSTFAACMGTHILMVSHHNQRVNHAREIVSGLMKALAELNAGKQIFYNSTAAMEHVLSDIGQLKTELEQQTKCIDEQVHFIEKQKAVIDALIGQLKPSTEALIKKQNEVIVDFEHTIEKLHYLDNSIIETDSSLKTIDESGAQLSKTVDCIEANQQQLAQAVSRFGIFVTEKTANKQLAPVFDDELMNQLDQRIEASDRLIEQIKSAGLHF